MISIEYEVVAPNYFQTMRIPLVEGREFTEADNAQSASVVIVNETMARRYWGPGRSPVGKRLRGGIGANRCSTVIGVARDVKYLWPTESASYYCAFDSNQCASFRDCTLEAMRTQAYANQCMDFKWLLFAYPSV